MEYHDGKPVTRHEAWFRKRVFEVPETDADALEEDRVVPWLVMGVSRDSSYHKRRDDPDAKARTCIIDVDTVAPLTGELREQAVSYLAASANGELAARASSRPSDIDLDRLADYLRAHHGVDAHGGAAVDAVIALLEDQAPAPLPGPARPELPPPPVVDQDDFMAGAEVIGTIYRNAKTHAVLDQAFSDNGSAQ